MLSATTRVFASTRLVRHTFGEPWMTAGGAPDVCSPTSCYNHPSTVSSHGLYHAWHLPEGLRFIDGHLCEPAAVLNMDYAVVPVVHSRARVPVGGLWLYYANGCSDLAWGIGRTLLSRNRIDLAVKLEQRQNSAATWSTAVARVARMLRRASPHWANEVVRRANGSSREKRDSQHAALYWGQQRSSSVLSLELLIADAARGMVVRGKAWNQGDFCRFPDERTGGSTYVRARALLHAFDSTFSANPLDQFNSRSVEALCQSKHGTVDTVTMYEQPAPRPGSSLWWTTEIWDVSSLCVARGVPIPAGPSGTPVGGPLWLNGSRCARPSAQEWHHCYSCKGSFLHRVGCRRSSHTC